jgi:hypothetical protein
MAAEGVLMKRLIVLVFLIFLSSPLYSQFFLGYFNYSYSQELGENNNSAHSLGFSWFLPAFDRFYGDFGINLRLGDNNGGNIYYNILFNDYFDDISLFFGLGTNISFNPSKSILGIAPQINVKLLLIYCIYLSATYRYNFYSKDIYNSHEIEFTVGFNPIVLILALGHH